MRQHGIVQVASNQDIGTAPRLGNPKHLAGDARKHGLGRTARHERARTLEPGELTARRNEPKHRIRGNLHVLVVAKVSRCLEIAFDGSVAGDEKLGVHAWEHMRTACHL